MAESIDKKTRKIADKRVESGKELESYQEAQNQLLAIQAEQEKNLAIQANNSVNNQMQTQTLGQAAEIMAMNDLNPTTQGVLRGYGLSQPRVIKETRVVKQGPQNITINNNTTNIAQGPVQGRDINIRPQESSSAQGKFKAWLSNVFARQDAQFQKQNTEYQRRESSLTRNANKMMRKLEGLGKQVASAMDPRKVAERVSNPFMNMLRTIGLIGFAAKLPKILNFFKNFEVKVRGWTSNIASTIGGKISEVFTGDKNPLGNFLSKINLDVNDPNSFFGKIKESLWNKNETGILNEIVKELSRILYERRELANKMVEIKGGGNIKNLITWLGAFFGGPQGVLKSENRSKQYEILETYGIDKDEPLTDRTLSSAETNALYSGPGRTIDLKPLLTNHKTEMIGNKSIDALYAAWGDANGYDQRKLSEKSTKRTFLRTQGSLFLIDEGESDILTYRLHKAKAGSGSNHQKELKLTRKDFDIFGHSLVYDNRRATLACSLDISEIVGNEAHWINPVDKQNAETSANYAAPYARQNPTNEALQQAADPNIVAERTNIEQKVTGKDIDVELLILLLNLLYTSNDILVFPKFINYFRPKTTIFKNTETVNIKLISEQMDPREITYYNNQYTQRYKKIVTSDVPDNKELGDPQKVNELDFLKNEAGKAKSWTVYRITHEQVAELLQQIVGTTEVDYTTDTQLKVAANLEKMGFIAPESLPELEGKINGNKDEDYDNAVDFARTIIRNNELRKLRRQQQRRGAANQSPIVAGANNYNPNVSYDIKDVTNQITDSNGDGVGEKFTLTAEEKRANMDKIRDALSKEGFTDPQIAGMMGVIALESGGTFDPRVVEMDQNGNPAAGQGIIQWTDKSRKAAFKKWWESQPEHSGQDFPGILNVSLDDQIGFLLEEFKKRRAYQEILDLKKNPNLSEAQILEKTVDLFTRGFVGGGSINSYADPNVAWDHYDENGKLIKGTSYPGRTYAKTFNDRLDKASRIMNSYFGKTLDVTGMNDPSYSPETDDVGYPALNVPQSNPFYNGPVFPPDTYNPEQIEVFYDKQTGKNFKDAEKKQQQREEEHDARQAESLRLALEAQSLQYQNALFEQGEVANQISAQILANMVGNNVQTVFSQSVDTGKNQPK